MPSTSMSPKAGMRGTAGDCGKAGMRGTAGACGDCTIAKLEPDDCVSGVELEPPAGRAIGLEELHDKLPDADDIATTEKEVTVGY